MGRGRTSELHSSPRPLAWFPSNIVATQGSSRFSGHLIAHGEFVHLRDQEETSEFRVAGTLVRRAIALKVVCFIVHLVPCSMNIRRHTLNFAPRPAPRGRDGKELIQCPTSSCDGMGHVSGNYATHRRQGSIDIDIDIDIDV
ncbi:hypothetical protein M0802_004767 [Mischocyttarus mexicanus]|nr:hypothetical protein M0802_004767 [Mischocyttarus mexicanus]